MRVSVIGCGYLGAVHAACMAKLGHQVVGLDVDEAKVADLSAGRPPFFEPGFGDLLAEQTSSGRLEFTTDPDRIADAEVHFVAVGTPQLQGRYAADLTYVRAAIDTILTHADTSAGPVVIAGKSTVPVGTAQRVQESANASGKDLVVVWNPEFLREGFAVEDTLKPDRIVYGLPDDPDRASIGKRVLDECYASLLGLGIPRMLTNQPTAELVKVAANSFLATKISFINAMAELCDATGGDVTQLADAIGYDPRIGRKFLRAGVGFGGGCLPKDIRAFMARAGELGVDEALTFLREVDAINLRQRDKAVDLASDLLGGRFVGHRVAVLGAAFKPNSDDLRDSPALDVAQQVWARGADLAITDPAAATALRSKRPNLNVVDTVDEAVRDADLVLLLTEWREYIDLDPVVLRGLVRTPIIIDGRNVLDPQRWTDAGWVYRGMGRHGGPTTAAGW
ncbi:nucleotide sugar dehydrogenase [Brooklawnia cerclae]|uniref:UDP-glucose 6-dehydrogenase n=1 Tax=Brooklawnia cerclae TaxID=349934 RepID=A0ABX0SIW9_9ACTN|nr:UDPglucose 6-dehydrogenase [Brooklawnia cerclae]